MKFAEKTNFINSKTPTFSGGALSLLCAAKLAFFRSRSLKSFLDSPEDEQVCE